MLQVKRRTTTSTHQEHIEAVQPTPRTRGQLRRLGVAQENSPTADGILKADQEIPSQLPSNSKVPEVEIPVQLPFHGIVLETDKQSFPVQLPTCSSKSVETAQQSPVQLPTYSISVETVQHSPVQLQTSEIQENVQQCSPVQLPSQVKVQETLQQSFPMQLSTDSKPLDTVQHSPVNLPPSKNKENDQQCSSIQLPSQVKVQETLRQSSPVQLPTCSKSLETVQQTSVQLPTYNRALETAVQLPTNSQETMQQGSPVQLPTYNRALETAIQLPTNSQETMQQSSPVQLPTYNRALETVVQLPTNSRTLETDPKSSIQLPSYNKALETIVQPPPYSKAVATVHQSLVQLPPQDENLKTVQQTLARQSTSADQQSFKTSVVNEAIKADKSGPSKQENDPVTLTVHSTSDLVNTEDHFKVDSKRYFGANPEEPLFIKFTELEEKNVVDFLILLYNLGYGFTKLDMARIATEYAVYLRKRTRTQPIVMHWVIEMISKWPELQLVRKKCKLNLTGILTKFFNNLENVMKRCLFDERPELVFSVTDIEIRQDDTESGEEKILTTVIACGSAAGLPVPPFFVFPGQKVTPDLMNEALPGSSGVVSDDGLVNAEVFIQFLNDHLLKNIPEEDIGKPILIHINAIKFCSVGLLDLAKKHNVTLIFPPMEIPNALMPLDVGCIVPFQTEYIRECKKHIQETMTDITINNVCGIVGKIYPRALTSKNIKEGFRKAGLFPCNRDMLIVKRKT